VGVRGKVLVAVFLSGAVFLTTAQAATPSGPATTEQEETAKLNLQGLQNSEIVSPPGVNEPDGTTTEVPNVPPAVGSARGAGGGRHANDVGGGGKMGKSRGSKGGGGGGGKKSVVKNKSYGKKQRHQG